MASFFYTHGLDYIHANGLSGKDVRALLVMSDSTADGDEDAENIADIGTLDEMDGSGYARVTLTGEAVSAITASDRSKFTSDAISFPTLGAGTRQVKALILYVHVTNDADARLIAYLDSGGFPFTADGSTRTFTPHADGLWYLRNNA